MARLWGGEVHEPMKATDDTAMLTPPEAWAGVPPDFSLVLGGPLYQLLLRTRMARPPLDLLHRRMAILALVAWLPLLAPSVLAGPALGPGGAGPGPPPRRSPPRPPGARPPPGLCPTGGPAAGRAPWRGRF